MWTDDWTDDEDEDEALKRAKKLLHKHKRKKQKTECFESSTSCPKPPPHHHRRRWHVTDDTLLSEEQELAKLNMAKWQEIEDCREKIRFFEARIKYLANEIKEITVYASIVSSVDNWTDDCPSAWDHLSCDRKASDKEAAWAIVKQPSVIKLPNGREASWKKHLPSDLQALLWQDSPSELRLDREMLLASLEWQLDRELKVELSESMLADKELLWKLTEKHPRFLLQQQGEAEILFDDEGVFRAALRGIVDTSKFWGVSSSYDDLKILKAFSSRLRSNADLMIEAVLALCDVGDLDLDYFVEKHLFDDKHFCLCLADLVSKLPDAKRLVSPLYIDFFSKRLRLDPEVIISFSKVNGVSLIHALKLQRDGKESLLKTDDVMMTPVFEFSKESVLQVFQDVAIWCNEGEPRFPTSMGRGTEEDLIGFFNCLPQDLQHDRDVAVAASTVSISLFHTIKDVWQQDQGFWLGLIERCGHSFEEYWNSFPLGLQSNYEVVLSVARNARFTTSSSAACPTLSFQERFAQFPDLLHDRPTLLRCLSLVPSEEMKRIASQIPQQVMGKDFCKDLLKVRGAFYECVPMEWRKDRDIVESALQGNWDNQGTWERTNQGTWERTSHCLLHVLPEGVQLQYPDLVVAAIPKACDRKCCERYIPDALKLGNREVVLAMIDAGWFHARLRRNWLGPTLRPDLRDDREILLAVASKPDRYNFKEHCPDALFRDKDFMLQAVKKSVHHLELLDESLLDDFDILLAAFSQDRDHADWYVWQVGLAKDCFAQRIFKFAREVRQRLQTYMSLMAFLGGISCRGSSATGGASCSLPLLNQGADTSLAYKNLIASFVGLPSGEELCSLRRASVGLTRWGC